MKTPTFTVAQLIAFGDHNTWSPITKRFFKKFREFAGLPGMSGDIPTAECFKLFYDALEKVPAAERAIVAQMPQELAAKWVKDICRRQAAEMLQARQAERERKNAEIRSFCDANRNKRIWRLSGLFLEDTSVATYTLAELESWRDVFGGVFQFVDPAIYVAAGDVQLDWSEYFKDYCGGKRRLNGTAFRELCSHLAGYLDEKRAQATAR